MNELFECSIPFRIVPKARPRITRRGHVYTPTTSQEHSLTVYLAGKWRAWKMPDRPAFDRAHVDVCLGTIQGKRGDPDNILKILLDALVKAHIIAGDGLSHILGLCLVQGSEKNSVLRIWEHDGE